MNWRSYLELTYCQELIHKIIFLWLKQGSRLQHTRVYITCFHGGLVQQPTTSDNNILLLTLKGINGQLKHMFGDIITPRI